MSEEQREFTGVFIAGSVSEIDFVETLLDAEGIAYEVRPEAFLKPLFGSVCLQGILFEVLAGQADYCRRLLRDRGLERGIVEPEES